MYYMCRTFCEQKMCTQSVWLHLLQNGPQVESVQLVGSLAAPHTIQVQWYCVLWLPRIQLDFWYFLPPSLCQCWCHVAETSPRINFGNDVMCLHFQLGYQQEVKGGRMGLNISWYVVLSPEKGERGERGTRLATNRRWRVGEWVQTFPSELLTTLLTSRLLLRYPFLAVHLSVQPATNSEEGLALRARARATFMPVASNPLWIIPKPVTGQP